MTDPTTPSATQLHTPFDQDGQSPWLDYLTRGYLPANCPDGCQPASTASIIRAFSTLSGVLAAKATTLASSEAEGPDRSNRRATSADRGQQ